MQLRKMTLIGCSIYSLGMLQSASFADELDVFTKALTEGSAKVDVRYRYENVDDDLGDVKNANAHTIRTRIGYGTGNYHGFQLYGEMEDIRDLFSEHFNSTTNDETEYAVVPDPKETELNQLYLQYSRAFEEAASFLIRYGRQRMKWDNDRFIGNVGWRQNEQTYDGTLVNVASNQYGLDFSYAYHTNVNRIFGDGAGAAGDFNVTSNNFHLNYNGLPYLNATGYYYLWEGEDPSGPFSEADSRKTAGVRLLGNLPVNNQLTLIGTAEYASQSDYKKAKDFGTLDYTLFEFGGTVKANENTPPITIKVGLETLEGDIEEGESFITPFATLHAFQGWADVFLGSGITGMYGMEAAGIEDFYVSIGTKVKGVKLAATYHEFEPEDSDSVFDEYGSEIDLLAAYGFRKHYTIGLKYADFNAKDDFRGDEDISKLWVWLEAKF